MGFFWLLSVSEQLMARLLFSDEGVRFIFLFNCTTLEIHDTNPLLVLRNVLC